MLAALCKGVGDVGPKFETHVPDLGAREYFNLLILDQLSRKLDLLKLFRRGREGVYFFRTHMQAMASIP